MRGEAAVAKMLASGRPLFPASRSAGKRLYGAYSDAHKLLSVHLELSVSHKLLTVACWRTG